MKIVHNLLDGIAEESDTITVEIEELIKTKMLTIRVNGSPVIRIGGIKKDVRIVNI